MMMIIMMMIIKIIIITIWIILSTGEVEDRFICSRQAPVAGCCKRGTETFGFHRKARNVLAS